MMWMDSDKCRGREGKTWRRVRRHPVYTSVQMLRDILQALSVSSRVRGADNASSCIMDVGLAEVTL